MNSQMMNTQKVQVIVTHAKAGMTITIKKIGIPCRKPLTGLRHKRQRSVHILNPAIFAT